MSSYLFRVFVAVFVIVFFLLQLEEFVLLVEALKLLAVVLGNFEDFSKWAFHHHSTRDSSIISLILYILYIILGISIQI